MFNKKNILGVAAGIATLAFAANAFAATPGVYVGGQLGYGDLHLPSIASQIALNPTSKSSTDTGLAGRLFAGYQLDSNWGAELGYTKFSDANSKAEYSQFLNAVTLKQTVKAEAFDLVAKGTLPLQAGFSVYGKLGAAYLMETTRDYASANVTGYQTVGSADSNYFLPTFGAGVAYDITSNVTTDISWNRIQKVGDASINNTDLVAVGLQYNFG